MLTLGAVTRGRDWGWLLFLAVLPNALSMLNIRLNGGLTIHVFQLGIFISARRYGVWGGVISGLGGSTYSAVAMGNPYLVLGNVILGGACGWLLTKGWPLLLSVPTAFLVQLLWLWPSDVWFQGMPVALVNKIVVSLLLTNLMWAGLLQLAIFCWKRR